MFIVAEKAKSRREEVQRCGCYAMRDKELKLVALNALDKRQRDAAQHCLEL